MNENKNGMLVLFTFTIFLGALLLFWVQPMAGRMLLPLLGGVPAVWNTAMVFYQATLLAGYAYAHFATKQLGIRRQAALHLPLLLLPLLALPIAIPHGWTPPTTHNPIPWLLTVLAVMVGLPFFIVSATSPLLQRWFSASGHRDAHDPYFLYAASNCGSLLALISYPVLIEPHLRLSQQGRYWAIGYIVLLVLTAICGVCTWRTARNPSEVVEPDGKTAIEQLTARRRLRWILLAFVPCSLMLSVTTYITTEVVPIPLMWVIPLGIYLLTFILVFAKRQLIPHRWIVWAMPFAVVVLLTMLGRMTLKGNSFEDLPWPIGVHFAGLFILAMFCHGELAKDRPTVAHLTEFFLWISTGGVLGGAFNALLAPLIFPTVIEYPATLLLACLLLPRRSTEKTSRAGWSLDVVVPACLGLLIAGLIHLVEKSRIGPPNLALAMECVPPAILCLFFFRRPLRFALGGLAILLATTLSLHPELRNILVSRSFFGIYKVEVDPRADYIHIFRHGTAMHGMQSLDARMRRVPLLFFSKSGPLGEVIGTLPKALKQHVGVIGLGAGTLACYGDAGEHWTFYEIDPEVERIADDPKYFTFLHDSPADTKVVLGDGRLSLQAERDGQFGLMVLDAYTSDTIPLHLVTREAVALYLRKLAPDGVMAFHITNRHLDLEPVLATIAQDAGVYSLCWIDNGVSAEEFNRTGKTQSWWLVMTRNGPWLSLLARDTRWRPPQPQKGVGLWTDDYESVFSVFHWN
ncbi:MAG TPA: fused MFS/spermidine synthase [Verrucomicrobiae bacterium]|nr:fused MFS/spermidine synthase [Verrucomicrobiae bacterium]